jgi:CRISPR-associated protein Csb2
VVHARRGFDRAALQALDSMRHVWGRNGIDVELSIVGLGTPDQLGCTRRDPPCDDRTPQLGIAQVWESITPFVPPRHIKYRRGGVRDSPREQLAKLLALHGFPPAQIEEVDPLIRSSEWQPFQLRRTAGGGSRGSDTGFGFRLRFEQPVVGPIALGYGAHQGLGQFVAVE